MTTILIVDDDAPLRRAMAVTVEDLGHTAAQAADAAACLDWLADHRADAVLLDLRMPGMDGMTLLKRIRALPAPPPVAVITAVPTGENTIEAMRLGAVDHLAKPVGRDALAALLTRMLPSAATAPSAPADMTKEGDLIGSSAAMREVQKSIGLLADSDATVLLLGETGTGKEVVARAIHRHGSRAAAPFIPVNCAAIPTELLESLLFGHVRGAFTGAIADRAGSFREAQRGTLFLDEIGDMDLAMQAKLLRVLQERVVTPVGGKPVPIDVRVVAATHRDLDQAVRAGTFREDLYLPHRRRPGRTPAPARPPRRHHPPGRTLSRSSPAPAPPPRRRRRRPPARPHLARQRPRTGQRHEACRHLGPPPRPGRRRPGLPHHGRAGLRPRHRPRLARRHPPRRRRPAWKPN